MCTIVCYISLINLYNNIISQLKHKWYAISIIDYGTACYMAIKQIPHNIKFNGNIVKQMNHWFCAKYMYKHLSHKYNATAITLEQYNVDNIAYDASSIAVTQIRTRTNIAHLSAVTQRRLIAHAEFRTIFLEYWHAYIFSSVFLIEFENICLEYHFPKLMGRINRNHLLLAGSCM